MDNYIDAYNEKEWNMLTQDVVKDVSDLESHQDASLKTAINYTKKEKSASSPVLTIQLMLCLITLTVLFLLKTFFFSTFADIKEWYDTELKASLFFSGDFSELNYNSIFGSTDDEI